ncbi:hypothetical protein GGS21DRAFT_525069 [Xylaria nigripes]|nr:hypothetical protein GGS21DRAFT_525069 [Xylaria nigripes]
MFLAHMASFFFFFFFEKYILSALLLLLTLRFIHYMPCLASVMAETAHRGVGTSHVSADRKRMLSVPTGISTFVLNSIFYLRTHDPGFCTRLWLLLLFLQFPDKNSSKYLASKVLRLCREIHCLVHMSRAEEYADGWPGEMLFG